MNTLTTIFNQYNKDHPEPHPSRDLLLDYKRTCWRCGSEVSLSLMANVFLFFEKEELLWLTRGISTTGQLRPLQGWGTERYFVLADSLNNTFVL